MWINSAKEWRQGFETPPAECPPVECGQSDGATGALDRKDGGDWKLPDTASVGPARPVRCNSKDAGVGQTTGRWVALRPDAGRVRPVSADVC